MKSNLRAELDRFRVAWNMNLARDVEPISRKAVEEGLNLLNATDPLITCTGCGGWFSVEKLSPATVDPESSPVCDRCLKLSTNKALLDFVYAHLQEAQFPTAEQTSAECIQSAIDEIRRVMECGTEPDEDATDEDIHEDEWELDNDPGQNGVL